jgi:hypothetical protein
MALPDGASGNMAPGHAIVLWWLAEVKGKKIKRKKSTG